MGNRPWTAIRSTDETNAFCRWMALEHLSRASAATHTSWEGDQIALLRSYLESQDYRALVFHDLRPACYTSAEVLAHVYQAVSFFTKRDDLEIGVDKVWVCTQAAMRAESECRVTNDIFRLRDLGELSFTPRVERVLSRARLKISRILGEVPSLEALSLRFGPGATTRVTKREANARIKLASGFQCTPEFVRAYPGFTDNFPSWFEHRAGLKCEIDTSHFSLVPKNAKTHRSIAVEPVMNSMLQLGIGDYMASRLRRAGIDIRDQAANQRLALSGSIDGWLATIDLSSASDLIATALVLDLLPIDWFCLLDSARSHTMRMEDGRHMRLAKFSSMGNGFTFPLETLIFYALAEACTFEQSKQRGFPNVYFRDDVRAYGDDIILPSDAVPLLTEVLTATGFRVNAGKSFALGPFRESCGTDYFLGIDVRPWFAKGRISDSTLYGLVNHYQRRGEFDLAGIAASVIEGPLLEGPDGYGDGHLVSDRALTPHGRDRGYCGFIFSTYRLTPRRERFGTVRPTDMAYALYTAYRSPYGGKGFRVTLRTRVRSEGRPIELLKPGGSMKNLSISAAPASFTYREVESDVEASPHPAGIDGSFTAPLTGVTLDLWTGDAKCDIVRVYTLSDA